MSSATGLTCPEWALQVRHSGVELRATVEIFSQKGVGAASIDEGATLFPRTSHICQCSRSMGLQIAEEVIDVAMRKVEIGLIAEGQRIAQREIIFLRPDL
jgi:hypothetical protein